MLLIKEMEVYDVKAKVIDFNYISDGYYDVTLNSSNQLGFNINYVLHTEPIKKHFSDQVVSEYIENPIVYYVYADNNEVAYLTLGIESWNQRLRIWNLLVLETYRHLGIGTLLINKAKEVMKCYQLRQIVLETQSCNNKAIGFYLKNNFKLIGLDNSCYSNFDIIKKEVRFEFGYTTCDETIKTIKRVLETQIKKYPLIKEVDVLKLIYQSEFGPGHFLSSKEGALNYIVEETKDLTNDNNELLEEIQDNTARVNLSTYINKGYDLKTLAEIFYLSSLNFKGDKNLFMLKVEAFKQMIKEYHLNFDFKVINDLLTQLHLSDYAPFSHSLTYKRNYEPHYRVIKKSILEMFFLNKETINEFSLPINKDDIATIEFVNKGWSNDLKYHLITKDGAEYLLRLSDINNYAKKKEEFEITQKIYRLGINMSSPLYFGVSKNGEIVYSLLGWIKGEDAEKAITSLTIEEQYQLGVKAGEYLRKIHSITYDYPSSYNLEVFMDKTNKRINSYKTSPVKVKHDLSNYILKHAYLVDKTPTVLLHGDFHLGNMIINEKNELFIIDFNRFDKGDPLSEFNRLGVFSAPISPYFAKGQVDGYIKCKKVPNLFWKRIALYTAITYNYSILWSLKFSKIEVEKDLKRSELLYQSFNGFKTLVPSWYKVEVK